MIEKGTKRALDFVKEIKGMYYEGEIPYTATENRCTISPPTRDLGFPLLNQS